MTAYQPRMIPCPAECDEGKAYGTYCYAGEPYGGYTEITCGTCSGEGEIEADDDDETPPELDRSGKGLWL